MDREQVWTEEYTVDGEALLTKLEEIIREGKARRIIVKRANGRTLLRVPLWLGAAAVYKNPGVLLLGAWMSRREPLTLIVERAE